MTMKIRPSHPRVAPLIAAALILSAAGCATRVAAPVSERQASEPVAAPVAARPDHYIVRQGDTLHSIARQFEVSADELVQWNELSNPDQLDVGTELRVALPDGVEVKPIASSAPVEVTPITKADSEPVAAPAELKTGPVGGVQPYSDAAWAKAQAASGATRPAARPLPEPAPSTAQIPTQSQVVDGVNWSWPAGGKVLGGFSDKSARKGLDIAGQTGDPVVAAAAGKVVYAGTGLRGYGKLVIIKHDAKFLSAYAHNDRLLVKEGDSVSKGQHIARLGSSDSDRPKLHFEIRRQGKPVDPSRYLPKR